MENLHQFKTKLEKQKNIPDQRMLKLIDKLQVDGVIKYKQDFYEVVGVPKQNIRRVKLGLQHFTSLQIARACKEFKVNANWIMGIDKTIYRSN